MQITIPTADGVRSVVRTCAAKQLIVRSAEVNLQL